MVENQGQPRPRQRGGQRISVDSIIEGVTSSKRFKELFDPYGGDTTEEVRREHRFQRVIERAKNRDVQDNSSWNEFSGVVEYLIHGLAVQSRLDMAIVSSLYFAQRQAFIRSTYAFMSTGIDVAGIIDDLKENQEKAVAELSNRSDKELHLRFSQRVFGEALFGRRT